MTGCGDIANVCFRSEDDIGGQLGQVGFAPKNGHRQSAPTCPLRAKSRNVQLFDHFVGPQRRPSISSDTNLASKVAG
jgi:hypothetical protein